MRETTSVLRPQRAERTISAGNLAMELKKFACSMGDRPENYDRFVDCLLAGSEEESNTGLYHIAALLITRLAEETDLDRSDAAAIEESRKICDVMGWYVRRNEKC